MNTEKIVTFLADRNHDIARVILWVYGITLFSYVVAAWLKDPLAAILADTAITMLFLTGLNYVCFGILMALTNIALINKDKK